MLCQALAAWDESLTSIIQSSRCLPHFSCLRVQHEEVLHLQKSNFVYEQSDVGSKTVTVNWILCMISYSFKPLQMAGAPTLQMLCSIARLQTHALLASSWQVLQRYLKKSVVFVSSSQFFPKFQAVPEKLHPGSPGSTMPTPIWRIWRIEKFFTQTF